MKQIYLLAILVFSLSSGLLHAQSCVAPVFADASAPPGTTSISMGCGGSTANMSATFNGQGAVSTNIYAVSSIPFSFTAFTGTTIPISTDDIWSARISLPFDFCFFGTTYNSLLVGSNGLVSFDVSTAGGFCPYAIAAGLPSATYPRAIIGGVYNDIDPRFGSTTRRIQYTTVGTAPCRQFIVSFEGIAYYGSTCPGTLANYQIILNESTNLIDVQIQNHNGCSSTNTGRGIIGIQNFDRTVGYTAPGRSAVNFATSNEAWRFTPVDTNSAFRRLIVHLYENGTLVDSTVPYYSPFPTLRADFTRTIVVPPDSHLFHIELIVRDSLATGSGTSLCAVSGSAYDFNDLLYYNAGSLILNDLVTNVNCFGESNGAIDLTATSTSPPISFVWSDGPTSEDRSALIAGTYTVTVSDLGGCTVVRSYTITEPPMLMIMLDSLRDVKCFGDPSGSIEITTMGGTMPYVFNWTGGLSSEDIYSLAAGTYDIMVVDSHGCMAMDNYIVLPGTFDTTTVNYFRCPGDSIFLGGAWRTVSGTYIDTLNNSHGCDSIITNNLTILSNSATNLNPVLCLGESIIVAGNIYNSTGIYRDTLTSFIGCDSIIVTDLIVNNPTSQSVNRSICDGDTYFAGGANQSVAGTYYDTLVGINGCDSVLSTILAVNSTSSTSEIYAVCFGSTMLGFTVVADTIVNTTYTNANGCDSINSVMINVLPLPVANAGSDQTINLGDSAILSASGGTYYQWNTGATTALTVVGPSVTSTFIVVVMSEDSCIVSDSVTVEVINPSTAMIMPDAFTPNGDNLNDKFLPVNAQNFAITSFIIINRWGNVVYSVNSNTDGWDGKFLNNEQPVGTYVYYIQGTALSNNEPVTIQGVISLIR